MTKPSSDETKPESSEKYSAEHAKWYFDKHEVGIRRRLADWRDHQICSKALEIAGNPKSILDMPCGTGRFWDLLAADNERTLWASDKSQNMIDAGLTLRPPEIAERFSTFQGSAFDLPVEDDLVESVFCMRLFHHIRESEDRLKILSEFARVSSDSVILSLRVDGNYIAWQRARLAAKRNDAGSHKRIIIPQSVIEQEFGQAGFSIAARLDTAKYFTPWRTYVLKK